MEVSDILGLDIRLFMYNVYSIHQHNHEPNAMFRKLRKRLVKLKSQIIELSCTLVN